VAGRKTKLGVHLSPALFLLVFAGVCFAPQPPAEPIASERDSMAEHYLASSLTRWQQRLQLQDWAISVKLSKPNQLRRGTLGNIHWDSPAKTAEVRVLPATEYSMPYHAALRDMEFTLVHELVHLELASLPRNDASRGDEEDAVNRVAEALLRLDRGE